MMKAYFHLLIRALQGSLLRQRDFRLMWSSSLITNLGGQITVLALPLTAVLLLNATPAQMGILVAVQAIPFTLFSLHVGVFLDRTRKLPILLACEAMVGLTLLSIPVMYALGILSMPALYCVGFLLGAAFVVVGSAAQVYLTHLAGRDHLIEANSLFTGNDSATRLAGPGVAGILIQNLSAPFAILIDCFGFLLSFALLTRIRFREPAPDTREKVRILRSIGEGLRLVLGHPILRVLGCCAAFWFFFFQAFVTLETLFAIRVLELSAGQIGIAHMIGGLGALAAAVFASRITRRLGLGTPILLGMCSSGLSWVLLASVQPGPFAFVLMGAALAFFDFGVMIYWINFSSLRQALTPDHLLGRMTATMRFFTVAPAPLGAYLGGLVASHIGPRATLYGVGSAVIGVGIVAFISSDLRKVRGLETLKQTILPVDTPPISLAL